MYSFTCPREGTRETDLLKTVVWDGEKTKLESLRRKGHMYYMLQQLPLTQGGHLDILKVMGSGPNVSYNSEWQLAHAAQKD